MLKLAVFDLDGTLTNSSETIYQTAIQTFNKLGLKVNLPKNELDKRIGAHFGEIFEELGIKVDDLENYIEIYKSLYIDFIEHTTLYPGVTDLLNFLVEKEIKVALLTTKAQTQAEMILEHFQLKKYFNYVMGRRPNIPHKPSPEPLKIILNELNVNPSEAIMIGDTEYDSRCGKSANAHTCLVTYGYRTEAQLKNESPDYLVNSISAIIQIFR